MHAVSIRSSFVALFAVYAVLGCGSSTTSGTGAAGTGGTGGGGASGGGDPDCIRQHLQDFRQRGDAGFGRRIQPRRSGLEEART